MCRHDCPGRPQGLGAHRGMLALDGRHAPVDSRQAGILLYLR